MRKHRSWLMGLGIGLILGASMLQLILMAQDQLVIATEQSITQDQLAEEAQEVRSSSPDDGAVRRSGECCRYSSA